MPTPLANTTTSVLQGYAAMTLRVSAVSDAKDQKAGIARKSLCVVLGLPVVAPVVTPIGTSVTVEYTQFPDVTVLVRAP